MPAVDPLPSRVRVLIAGGGPVGLATAALLGAYGIDSLVVEADEGYCTGSRAICLSRRSLEILGWVGADRAVTDKGLGWTSGRSYFRDREILRFDMPHDPGQRFAPMTNLQQFHVERFLHEAALRQPGKVRVAWSTRVTGVGTPHADGAGAMAAARASAPDGDGAESPAVRVELTHAQGTHVVHADWLVACDGGRSTVRDCLGLALHGTQYEGRYVIVDIEQASSRPTERLAWFDPPSNPGSTLLMHRQPDDVWRIDYQIGPDDDAQAAVHPDNVLPRVQAHLDMIGETAPWRALWISLYNAKCLTLERYRHGRVLFAGDAGHLVPIFGVRGLNSGLDDAANLAWKLAWVLRGGAPDSLLDSFSDERVQATHQNLAYGAKSTEFMAPPDAGFRLMREAALRLALVDPSVRSLINPRQSAPVVYGDSPLRADDGVPMGDPAWRPGAPAPDGVLPGAAQPTYLSQHLGQGFLVLAVDASQDQQAALQALCADMTPADGLPGPRLVCVASGARADGGDAADPLRAADIAASPQPFAALRGLVVVLRPDGYVLGRWPWQGGADADPCVAVRRALAPYHVAAPSAGEAA